MHEDGTVLKPVQVPPKGQTEVEFYQEVFGEQASTDKVLLQLRELVPKFHGIVHAPKEPDGKDVTCLGVDSCTIKSSLFGKYCMIFTKQVGSHTYRKSWQAKKKGGKPKTEPQLAFPPLPGFDASPLAPSPPPHHTPGSDTYMYDLLIIGENFNSLIHVLCCSLLNV